MRFTILSFIILVVLSSCSGTKNLTKADIDMPSRFMPGEESASTPDSLSLADLKWWEFYSDSTLSSIMKIALENNLDILKAAAKVDQMREMYGVAKANMLPEIGFNVAYSHETNKYDGGPTSKDPEHDLKFPISWEFNLWGSLQKATNAGEARYAASVEDYRSMRMTLIAEVATTYFRLLSLENELAIVRQTLKTREEALHQAKLRFEGGLTSETVYQQAMVEYSSTASLIPDLELKVTSMRNSLTMLMGEYPKEAFERRTIIFDPDVDKKLPFRSGIVSVSVWLARRLSLSATASGASGKATISAKGKQRSCTWAAWAISRLCPGIAIPNCSLQPRQRSWPPPRLHWPSCALR